VLKDEALTEIAAHPPEAPDGLDTHPRRAQGLSAIPGWARA